MIDLQERIESSPAARATISGAILFVLAVMLGANLPVSSPLKDQINQVVQPVRDLVGLDQYWGVFAPDPRMETWGIRALITYTDGTTAGWSTPQGDAFLGEYRFYRWNKYAEQVFQRDRRGIWPDLAKWLIRNYDRPGLHPVRVELIKRWYVMNPPGSKVSRGPWNEEPLYVVPVTPQLLREATA